MTLAPTMTPPVRTPLTRRDALGYLAQAYAQVFDAAAPAAWLRVFAAFSAFETGFWRAIWCNNWGNQGGGGPGGAWTNIPGAGEVVNGKAVPRATGQAGAFAVFPDPLAGAVALIRFVGTASHPGVPNRYQAAWDAALAGDVAGFAHGLKCPSHGLAYMTDGEAHYAHGVSTTADALAPDLDAFLAARGPATDPAPPPEGCA